jgi:hypothetical protein
LCHAKARAECRMRLTSLTSRQVKAVALFVAIYVLLCVVLARVLPAEGASSEKALLHWLLGIPRRWRCGSF